LVQAKEAIVEMGRRGDPSARDILAAAGASGIRVNRRVVYGGWHLLGSAWMSNDLERSVVNAWGRRVT
jgi:hypothetical protein